MKLKQISVAGFRQDSINAYDINVTGFRVALLGATKEIPLLELCASMGCYGIDNRWPFKIEQMAIPQERPCSEIIEHLELAQIYAISTTQESQELALDPIYVAGYSSDAPKARIKQVEWAPSNTAEPEENPTLAVLTSYGACQLRKRNKTSRKWSHITVNINELYMKHVFPFEPTSLQQVCNLKTFKEVVDLQYITAFAWHPTRQVLYTANAVGWVVAFRYETLLLNDVTEYFKLLTNLGRITYMRAFDDFLLIGNCMGVVKLYKLNSDDEAPTINEAECLWSRQDRMSCLKAEANYSKDFNCYYVIFAKSSHVLGYRLGTNGSLLSSCILYVGGVKITGLETLQCNEFIVSVITGVVKHLKLEINDSGELQITQKLLCTDLDTKNYQILGIAATPNKNLWTFLLYRNKDYLHQSKKTPTTAYLSICKLTSIDSLQKLSNLNVRTMNPFLDYAVAIRLDIVRNSRHQNYDNFFDLNSARFPTELNDAFLQTLQLKLLLVKSQVIYESETYKQILSVTDVHFDFLLGCLQTTYILYRMQQLQHIIGEKTPTIFQNLVGSCLKQRFHIVITNIKQFMGDESIIKNTLERFFAFAIETFQRIRTNYESSDMCLVCQEAIDETTMRCMSSHKVRRCCVSYVQLPILNQRHCIQCNEGAFENDTLLQEILGPDEVLKCTFCRLSFVNDSIK